MIATGAAVTLTGGVLVYLNRGRTVYREAAPLAAPVAGGAIVGVQGRF